MWQRWWEDNKQATQQERPKQQQNKVDCLLTKKMLWLESPQKKNASNPSQMVQPSSDNMWTSAQIRVTLQQCGANHLAVLPSLGY